VTHPTTKAQAEKVRYGAWGGCPEGVKYNPGQCAASVTPNDRFSVSHQCYRKPGHGPGGLYCAQHDPDAIRKRQAESSARYDREMQARIERSNDADVGEALRSRDPDLYAKLLKMTEASK